ncbi:acyl carrier protein [Streptomyces noursei]|uniref:acyl carrier protein n=1 Tax=Streptomyces TaxID=1883 RepID=UPI0023B80E5C|nr:phosphopantetheine-binding protein [Streptomyces noursei]
MPVEPPAAPTTTPAVSEDEIARFVVDHFLDDDVDALDPERDLLAEGSIDSLGVLHVVAWLENRYGVTVPTGALSLRNFRSVRAIRETAERVAAGGGEA